MTMQLVVVLLALLSPLYGILNSAPPLVVVTVLEAGSRDKLSTQDTPKGKIEMGQRVKYSNVNWPDKIIEATFVRYHSPKVAIVKIENGEEKKIPAVRITPCIN